MKTHDLNVENLKKRIRELESDAREYQRMEDELRTSQERFRILIETLPYGVVEVSLDGVITLTNRAMHVLCDAADDGEGLVGRHIGDLIADPDENAAMPALMQAAAESLRPAEPYVTRIRTRRNRRIDVQVAWDYKRGEGGSVFGFIAVVTDITERLKADRALKESEQRYRSLFEKAGDAIFLIQGQGPDAGKILDANQAAADMHGYTLEELKSMSIQQIDGPEDADKVADRLRRILGGEWIHAQITHYRKDGSAFPVSLSAGLVSMGDKKVVLGIDRDITEQEETKAALQEQVVFLQTLIDTIPNPIFYKDTHGRYLGCNKAFETFVDMSRRDIVGRTIREIDNILQADEIEAVDRVLFASREPQIYEGTARLANETPRPVIFNKAVFYKKNGEIGGLVGSLIDIKDLRQVEKEKTLLATAIEQSPEIVIVTDANGRIHYVNPAFERITGYGRDEAAGRTPSLLKSGKHDDAFFREMWQTLTAGNSWKGRITNRRRDGSLFDVEATIVPVQRTDGQITDYLAVERDITREIQREKQLRQTQKMEAIGTLAGGIAHDFNNILSAIIGFTEIALHDLPADAPTRTFLSRVLTAGDRARALVNQILAFSRASEQASRPVDIGHITKEVLKLLEATLPSTIAIHTRIEASATVLADPTQIHQVVMNLCTNAAHAMQQNGGDLTLTLSRCRQDEEMRRRHPEMTSGPYVLLRVEDTGCGIDPDVMERIFDPFYTTKKQGQGTGMGLSVVHGIIKSCNGFISVQSTPGQGACFEILLPVMEGADRLVVADPDFLSTGSEQILFVDDEPFQVELGQQMLSRLGYRVTAVPDSREALSRFRASPDHYDLVITDMTMPHMTGDALAEQILRIRPGVPVILCTGYSERLGNSDALPDNIAGVVYKPLIMKKLAGLVRRAIDRKTL